MVRHCVESKSYFAYAPRGSFNSLYRAAENEERRRRKRNTDNEKNRKKDGKGRGGPSNGETEFLLFPAVIFLDFSCHPLWKKKDLFCPLDKKREIHALFSTLVIVVARGEHGAGFLCSFVNHTMPTTMSLRVFNCKGSPPTTTFELARHLAAQGKRKKTKKKICPRTLTSWVDAAAPHESSLNHQTESHLLCAPPLYLQPLCFIFDFSVDFFYCDMRSPVFRAHLFVFFLPCQCRSAFFERRLVFNSVEGLESESRTDLLRKRNPPSMLVASGD